MGGVSGKKSNAASIVNRVNLWVEFGGFREMVCLKMFQMEEEKKCAAKFF
jgi:hypothetical protein